MAQENHRAEKGTGEGTSSFGQYANHAYDEVNAERIKKATGLLEQANKSENTDGRLSTKELDVVRALEKATLTGDVATMSRIERDFENDPQELRRIAGFASHAFWVAAQENNNRLGNFSIDASTDPKAHLSFTGERAETIYGPPELEIYSTNATARTHIYDGKKDSQIADPNKVAKQIGQQLLHDIVDR